VYHATRIDGARWLPSGRGLLVVHLVALVGCLAAGFVICGTDLGWSDSLWLTQPWPSPMSYVASWYKGLNGRLAQAITAALARIPFSRIAAPEQFPFWVFSGLSFWCAAMAPLLIGASIARATRSAASGAAVAALLLAVWSTNPVLFANATYHHFAIFIDYLLPTYLTALWFRHALELASRRPSRRDLVVHGLGYLFLSNYVEVFLLTLPLLAILAWVLGRGMPRTVGQWARIASAYGALSAAAALVYWVSPGQHRRAVLGGTAWPTLAGLPLDRVRDVVAVQFLGLSGGQGAVAYGLVLLGFAGLAAWTPRSRGRASGDLAGSVAGTAGLVAAAGLIFIAHAIALVPALMVHVAGRVAIYPALLLVTSVGLALLAVAQGMTPPWAKVLLGFVAALALGVAGLQLRQVAAVQKDRKDLFALRRSIYAYVLGLHHYSGASAFVLTDCNLAPHGEPIEPPWGLQAYFAWGRQSRVRVFVDANDDFASRPPDLNYTVVSCRQFLSRPHGSPGAPE
jgi:hypothetical protein